MGTHPHATLVLLSVGFSFFWFCETVGWTGFELRSHLIGSLSMIIPKGVHQAWGSSGEQLSINSVQSSALTQKISQQYHMAWFWEVRSVGLVHAYN